MPLAQQIEAIETLVARTVATNPAGHNLVLIGGFRYRLLDQSPRFSRDVDYHWEGDLTQKQQEIVGLFRRTLLGQVTRQLSYEGTVAIPTGPEFESPRARFIELRFWRKSTAHSQILVPVEITRIPRRDAITLRTVGGIVYPTASDADLIEGKIIAVINRIFVEHRDLVDIFLFGDRLLPDSPGRISEKIREAQMDLEFVRRRLDDLGQNAAYHARSVQNVIDTQLEPTVAAQINAAGRGQAIFERAFHLVRTHCTG